MANSLIAPVGHYMKWAISNLVLQLCLLSSNLAWHLPYPGMAWSTLPSLCIHAHLQFVPLLGFPGGSTVKNLPAKRKTWVWSLGGEDPLEKGLATHSSILAWRIPWTEKPGVGYSPWGHRELDTTEQLSLPCSVTKQQNSRLISQIQHFP